MGIRRPLRSLSFLCGSRRVGIFLLGGASFLDRPSGTMQRQGAQQTPTASHAWILGRGPHRFFWFWG